MPELSLSGVLPVLHTPFLENGQIDRESLQREIDWAFGLGVNGVCAAMVSEILRLTIDERLELAELMVKLTAGRGVVVTSIGAESTAQALWFGEQAQQAGCHAVMAVPPISTALPDDVLYDYFASLAEGIELPLIVQDASSYVGRAIPLELYVRLLKHYGPDKILFKPEASPIGPHLSALRDMTGGQARVFDGSGGILLVDAFRRGVIGTMPGCDLLDGIVALWKALKANSEKSIYPLSFPISAIVALQLQAGLDGFLAIEKYLMVKRGLFTSDRRREPYTWSLDDETAAEVDRLFVYLEKALAETGNTTV